MKTGSDLQSEKPKGEESAAAKELGADGGLAALPVTTLESVEARLRKIEKALEKTGRKKQKVSFIIFSGDLDHALVAFIIAIACQNLGLEVSMFFNFWGLHLIKDPKKKVKPKNLMMRLMGMMRPNGIPAYKLSQMHMGGMGTAMMKGLMKDNNIISLEERMDILMQNGVKIYACDNSLLMMGLGKEDLIDYKDITICGAGKFAADSADNAMTLVF